MTKHLFITLVTLLVGAQTSFAREALDGLFDRTVPQKTQTQIVDWVGLIYSKDADRNDLEFIRDGDQAAFDVEDTSNLRELNWKDHQSRVVRITAEKTSRFLFWGGDLIVRDFKVLKEAGKYRPQIRAAATEQTLEFGPSR